MPSIPVLGAKPVLYGGQTSLPSVRKNLAEGLTKFIDELGNASGQFLLR